MKVIDCTSTGKSIPTLKKAGITAVIRYFGIASWKNATRGECNALKDAVIDIAAVYETTNTMMLQGRAAGAAGAKVAKDAILACGGPANPFVYFACDTDTSSYAKVNDYLTGAASVLGAGKVGIYGSYDVCANALKAKAATKAWQTLAWSNGKRLASAALYQDNGSKAYGNLGISYDVDLVQAADFGQWGYTPVPVPGPVGETITLASSKAHAHRLEGYILSGSLRPLLSGASVVISYRRPKETLWRPWVTVKTNATGTYAIGTRGYRLGDYTYRVTFPGDATHGIARYAYATVGIVR